MRRGQHLQMYLADLPGNTASAKRGNFDAACARWASAGGIGVALHAVGTTQNARQLGSIARDRGLQVSIAHGLGQTDSHEPEKAAERMARYAQLDGVVATIEDAEKAWRNEPSDIEAAERLSARFRALCPDALLVGQFVPVLQTKSTDFKWFGRREFLRRVDATAPMAYNAYEYGPAHWRNPLRYGDFAKWRAAYASLGTDLGIEQTWRSWETLQAYTWSDIVWDLVDCLMTVPDGVTLLWGEAPAWNGADEILVAMRAVRDGGGTILGALRVLVAGGIAVPDYVMALAEQGFTGPDRVRKFQLAHPPLVADNKCGPRTRKALGLP